MIEAYRIVSTTDTDRLSDSKDVAALLAKDG